MHRSPPRGLSLLLSAKVHQPPEEASDDPLPSTKIVNPQCRGKSGSPATATGAEILFFSLTCATDKTPMLVLGMESPFDTWAKVLINLALPCFRSRVQIAGLNHDQMSGKYNKTSKLLNPHKPWSVRLSSSLQAHGITITL